MRWLLVMSLIEQIFGCEPFLLECFPGWKVDPDGDA